MPSETIFRVPLWLFSFSLISLTLPACAQQAAPTAPAAGEITSYGDCSMINFKDIDGSELTKAELLQQMDADFAANLNQSEKCMAQAINSGAGQISAAGAAAGADAAAGTGEQVTQSAGTGSATEQAQADNDQAAVSSPSKATPRGKAQQGSSAVCATVKQGLAAATSDSEKKHFSALMTQYGCE